MVSRGNEVGPPGVEVPVDEAQGSALPTRVGAAIWRAKVTAHQARRLLDDLGPRGPRRLPPGASLRQAPVLASSRTPLWSTDAGPEWVLEAGKVENLRRAIRSLHEVEVAPGQLLGFWAQVGPPWAMRGFVEGREVREGCIIPSIAGGLCQLSNALYDTARRAGMEIVERHAHSRVVPGSAAAAGQDATVMWNYVDLRVRWDRAFRIEAELLPDALVLRLRGYPYQGAREQGQGTKPRAEPERRLHLVSDAHGTRSCLSCQQDDCHRARPTPVIRTGHRAWLVDGVWPEHDAWMAARRDPADILLLPLDGKRLRRARYAWSSEGFAAVHQFPALTLRRALQSRRLAAQGAARQQALLRHEARLAAAMAQRLPPSATHLVVAQTLLPHLWRLGALGGRRFDVLMTRPPLHLLHDALDRAHHQHPYSSTLADFRADPAATELERQALAAAEHLVTPHAGLARALGDRAVHLGWARPPRTPARQPKPRGDGPARVWFPASTLGRKGAYELREALSELRVSLVLGGPVLEQPDFWGLAGLPPTRPGTLDDADLVVLPAHVETAPRRLLTALARGVPVIASDACGLEPEPGLVVVPTGDAAALREAIEASLARGPGSAPRISVA
ncbi:VanW family protein [Paraliomyxa miuraensis]|uniref:VanW family protein n=1 Tax=Paraliomyxa miuraensis TaxID=376150 RepID=UPI00224F138B|nr:VanW family protein [Paraliomyxa miuraensis]MCX4240505.1 VanW family protein [Paraliomyxa miuraensis]